VQQIHKASSRAFCSYFQICVSGLTSWPVRASHAHNRETNRAGKNEEKGRLKAKATRAEEVLRLKYLSLCLV